MEQAHVRRSMILLILHPLQWQRVVQSRWQITEPAVAFITPSAAASESFAVDPA